MLELGKMQEIGAQLKQHKVDLPALQQIRWRGEGQFHHKDFTILYSGDDKQGHNGEAYVAVNKLQSNILKF